MKIIVLDGYALNPGDLSWAGLEALGECTVYDRTSPELIAERAREAEAVLINKIVLGRAEMEKLPRLRYIGVLATGYDIVDVAAARELGIVVTNIPAYGTMSVAQMTFALLLELAQHVGHHAETVRQGRWTRCEDFCYWDLPLLELEGLALGLVGYGKIGQAVGRIAQAFGMRIIVHTRSSHGKHSSMEYMELDDLFRCCDVVSLHCPLTKETRTLVNAQRLALMKPTAFLINTSRGLLVDEQALAMALNEGQLAGAALDVLSKEPPGADNPLLTARNCLITPHIAWGTTSARKRLLVTALDNLRAFLANQSKNVVNS